MAVSHVEQHVPSSPSYEPSEDYTFGGNPQHLSSMPFDAEPASEETRITEAQTHAERLLALRAPLIERGKRVPFLERSIDRHELEAKCLNDLLTTARNSEKVLSHRLDEAHRELEFERLETDMVRERLRTAEIQLAKVGDLYHVKEAAYDDEIALLKTRCVNLKRKNEALTSGQRNDSHERMKLLEQVNKEYRLDLLSRTQERDQWRETAISSEEQLKVMKARKAKSQTLSALLQTERTLSASLRKQLEEARKTAKTAEGHKPKSIARDSEKEKHEKALEAEKAKTTDLRQKLKQNDASIRKTQRDMTKLRQTCDDLEKKLKDALERAVHAEERAADLENRPAVRSRGLASPRGDMLMSPAPLQISRQPAEDIASESRSRFTATLPLALQDEGSVLDDDDDDLEGLDNIAVNADVAPRSRRKNSKPHKLAPPRKLPSKRPVSSREMAEPISLREPETKKRRRTGPAKKVNNPSNDSDKALTGPSTPSDDPSDAIVTPRRKHGKATRKTTSSSPAKKREEEHQKEKSSTEAPRRTLRSRRPISYNYDEKGRDLVSTQDDFEVDFEALQPLPARARETRSSKSKKSNVVSVVSDQYAARGSLESPTGAKRPRRGQTIRKQVPVSRSRAR